jgi:solute:Na+ symporter, SSS family
MSGLDCLVILLYVVGIFIMGGIFSRRIKTSKDMFAAGGASPWWVSGLSNFMTMFSAGTFVVWGGIAYKFGFVAISISLCNGIAAIIIGWVVAAHWKKTGVTTGAEFITLRFGKSALQFYTWATMAYKMLAIGVALYSVAVLLSALVPMPEGSLFRDPVTGHFAVFWAVIIFGCIVIAYTVVGGLWAVLMTDVLQFIVLSLAVTIVVPLILGHDLVGGIGGFLGRAPEGFFSPVASDFTWIFLLCWAVMQSFSIGGEWGFVQRFLCVSSEKDARKSAWLFGILYLVSPLIWMLPPMVYRLINPDADPKEAYILACREVLPAGLVGLMLAAMFSATASMIDSQLNVFSGVLTRDFYKALFRKQSTEHHLVIIGRLFTVVLGLVLIGISLAVPSMGGVENVVLSIGALLITPLMAPTVWGLLSRRIDSKAVWLTAGIGFFGGVLVKFGFADGGFLTDIPALSHITTWIQSHYRSVEIAVGVLVPVAVLALLEWRGRETDDGWKRVMKHADTVREDHAPSPSNLPARIITWNISALGILMLFLSLIQDDFSYSIVSFAVLLISLAGGIHIYLRMKKPAS